MTTSAARRRARARARPGGRRCCKHFGSLKRLRAATVEEIAAVPGIGRRTRRGGRRRARRPSRSRAAVNAATGEILDDGPAERLARRPGPRPRAQHAADGRRRRPTLRARRSSPACPGPAAARRPTCLEDLGWFVVDNLPPRCCSRRLRRARRRTPRRGSSGSPSSSTSAAGRSSPTSSDAHRRGSRARRSTRRRLPRGHRRGAGAPLRGGPPPAPAAGRRPAARRHRRASASCSPTCAATPTSSSTPPALNVHQLRAKRRRRVRRRRPRRSCGSRVMSFGFKYGLPARRRPRRRLRFLPNPHWVPELRPLTGLDRDGRATTCSASRAPSEFLDAYGDAARHAARPATCARASAT